MEPNQGALYAMAAANVGTIMVVIGAAWRLSAAIARVETKVDILMADYMTRMKDGR